MAAKKLNNLIFFGSANFEKLIANRVPAWIIKPTTRRIVETSISNSRKIRVMVPSSNITDPEVTFRIIKLREKNLVVIPLAIRTADNKSKVILSKVSFIDKTNAF